MAFTAADWGRGVLLTGLAPSASLTGYVALVSLDNVPVESVDAGSNSALNGGGDLRFSTDINGANQLPLEVVSFVTNATPSSRSCQLWVRFPTYASGTREVYMFYSKAGESQPAVGAAFGRNAVYQNEDRRFLLQEELTDLTDRSGNVDATASGTSALFSPLAGFGDNSVGFPMSQIFELGADPVLGASHLAVRVWLSNASGTGDGISGRFASNTDMTYLIWASGGVVTCRIRSDSGSVVTASGSTAIIGTGTHHVAVIYDGSTISIYVNGVIDGSAALSGIIETSAPSVTHKLATYNSAGQRWIGLLQEYSLSTDSVIDGDYVSSEYNNQNSPATFWTTGTPFTPTGSGISITGATANYNYAGIAGSIDLTGEVIITGSTANYNYTGITATIELGAEIIVTGQTASYNYVGVDGSVELTGLITVLGQTANYDYDGISADVTLQGSIIVSGSTANYDYNALNATIILQGPITINPKNIVRVKRKSNTIRVKRNSNIIRVR